MDAALIRLPALVVKTMVVHTVTYIIMGLYAVNVLNYAEAFARPEMICWMRQTTDPMVMAGPLLQPVRGLIFALAFYPLRSILFGTRRGWLILWWLLVALGILSTFGPAPGSVEGMIYTRIPIADQLAGLSEVIPQALLLSVILSYWLHHPDKRWLSWTLGVVLGVFALMMVLGLVMRP